MEKNKLLNFISKYSLAGSVETVEWLITESSISTRFMTDQQDVIGDVSVKVKNESVEDTVSLGIANTSVLTKMLSVLDEEISIAFKMNSANIPVSITLQDQSTVLNYMVADRSIIQQVPIPKKLPDFDYEFDFNRETFSDKFVKAKAAFSDADIFTIAPATLGIAVCLGSNENNLTMSLPNITGAISRPISFDAKLLKEILVANKDSAGGKFSIIEGGIAKLELFVDGYSVVYYLVEKIKPS
jgi:hypothetical protein